MRFSIKDRKPCCRGKFWSFFDPRKSRNRDRNFLGSRSGGLGCATTDRIFFWSGISMEQPRIAQEVCGKPRGGPATLLNAFRAKSRLSVFSWKMGEISWKMDSDQKSVSTVFLLWTQRSQKWCYFLLEPFLHSVKTKKPSSTILRHLNFLGKQCNGRWQSRGPIFFSWKVLISMESKLDRIFGPKAIEWLFAENQPFYEHS